MKNKVTTRHEQNNMKIFQKINFSPPNVQKTPSFIVINAKFRHLQEIMKTML